MVSTEVNIVSQMIIIWLFISVEMLGNVPTTVPSKDTTPTATVTSSDLYSDSSFGGDSSTQGFGSLRQTLDQGMNVDAAVNSILGQTNIQVRSYNYRWKKIQNSSDLLFKLTCWILWWFIQGQLIENINRFLFKEPVTCIAYLINSANASWFSYVEKDVVIQMQCKILNSWYFRLGQTDCYKM